MLSAVGGTLALNMPSQASRTVCRTRCLLGCATALVNNDMCRRRQEKMITQFVDLASKRLARPPRGEPEEAPRQ